MYFHLSCMFSKRLIVLLCRSVVIDDNYKCLLFAVKYDRISTDILLILLQDHRWIFYFEWTHFE